MAYEPKRPDRPPVATSKDVTFKSGHVRIHQWTPMKCHRAQKSAPIATGVRPLDRTLDRVFDRGFDRQAWSFNRRADEPITLYANSYHDMNHT